MVTEFKDKRALGRAAEQASRELGHTRMWSIHPEQIRVIIVAFAPVVSEVDDAVDILRAGQAALRCCVTLAWAMVLLPLSHQCGLPGEAWQQENTGRLSTFAAFATRAE